jgi:hypothetical protein
MTPIDATAAVVARVDLVDALAALKRMLGRKKNGGDGVWRFDPIDGLRVAWGASEETVSARVFAGAFFEVHVDNGVMSRLADALPDDVNIELAVGAAHLRFGSFRVAATVAKPTVEPTVELASDAALIERYAAGTRDKASDGAVVRLEAAAKSAAALLASFGVEEVDVYRFVLEQARARAERRRNS